MTRSPVTRSPVTRSPGGRPLQLLVVGAKFPPESFLDRLFRGLAAPDLHLWIACKKSFRSDHPFIFPWSTGGSRFALPGRGTSILGKHPWDLLYFPWNSGAVSHLELLGTDPPSIVSCRGSQVLIAPHVPGREKLTDAFPEMFRRAAAVHCVSRDIREAAVALGLDPEKARVITPAVDETVFFPDPKARPGVDGPLEIVGLGSLIWRKGFEDALVALGKLRDRGVDFLYHLVGDGPDRQRLLFTAHDLGLRERILFHGGLETKAIVPLLQQSPVFLLSSVCEGISNAALEAMACGAAVVSTRCGGMEEAIAHGENGLLVPTRDPDALADALARLAGDELLRRRLGLAARRRIEEDFRLADQVAAFRELCLTTAAGSATVPEKG